MTGPGPDRDARTAAEALFGVPVSAGRQLGSVTRIRLADGRDVVLKRGAGPGATAAEAASLRWLAAAGARVPEVLAANADWLAIPWIAPGPATPAAAEDFGRTLSDLHSSGAPGFGAPPPGGPADAWIGLAPLRNQPAPGAAEGSWAEWYAGERVLPYLRTAVAAGTLGPDQAAVVERACARLPDTGEPPSRLHGDLWSGNVHWAADGHVWLIDPAAHGGHRESDLAMLHLFGCPRLDRVLAAYTERTPLADGWPDRIGAHQLFPLAVHTALFGTAYADRLLAAARTLG